MAKIMVLGDTHGNINEAVFAVHTANDMEVDTIVQCGDFGLWDHFKDGIDFLDQLNMALIENGIVLVWVDGNHENFDRLEWYCANNPKNIWGQVFIRTNILYSPRGATWELDGKRCMSVGGAVSVDKASRIQKQGGDTRQSWWPQEQLTDDELDYILDLHDRNDYEIDFLFTHDCPSNAPFQARLKNDMDSVIHRQRMDRLGREVMPRMWFHGHMHTKYDGYDFPTYESTTKVYGLECDGMLYNWGILDTDTYGFEWGEDLYPTFIENEMPERQGVDPITGVAGEWVPWEGEWDVDAFDVNYH